MIFMSFWASLKLGIEASCLKFPVSALSPRLEQFYHAFILPLFSYSYIALSLCDSVCSWLLQLAGQCLHHLQCLYYYIYNIDKGIFLHFYKLNGIRILRFKTKATVLYLNFILLNSVIIFS